MLREQYATMGTQVPLMYLLMFINACFLGIATHGQVSPALSLGVPAALSILISLRAAVWAVRRRKVAPPAQIRKYLYGTVLAAFVLSACFGGWGVLLFNETDPVRATSVALYVFVGSISCCYCLQALPLAGWFVLMFGAMPVTVRLLLSGDWYLVGIGLTFLLVAGVILRTLAASHWSLKQMIKTRTEMSAAISALEQSEEHHRYSVDLNPQIPWVSDASGAVIEFSPRWSALTGLSLEESLGTGWSAALHPEDLPSTQELWARAIETGEGEIADARFRLRHADGSYRWHRSRAWPRLDNAGKVILWYGNLEDVDDQMTAERALQNSEERYRLAALASNDVIWDISLERDHIAWSSAAATVLGYPEAVAGTTRHWWLERIHPEEVPALLALFTKLHDPEFTQWTHESRFRSGEGKYLNVITRGHVVRDETGRATRMIGSLQDVTEQKRYERDLKWAAHYDSLTHLPNRVLFAERLDNALIDARGTQSHVGLVVLDVDRFKTINDSLGHDTGDALLCEIAERLLRSAPSSATVARLGGDEFAIIVPGLQGESEWADAIGAALTGLSDSMHYRGREIEVSLSAGAALAFRDGENPEELHKSADLALYAAKSEGLGQVCFFRSDLREAAERETKMLSDARCALQDGRIVPFYQPKVCLRTGKLTGFEALLRWHHHKGLQPPAGIRAAFEDTGMSVQLTDRMLERVISDMVFWRDHDVDFGRIAINGSPGDFRRGDFAERILNRLHKAELPPSVIELEVTEAVFLGQLAENVSAALNTLSEAGVTIALDDFGTGYASLKHLKQFPVNTLKIDRSFVSRLGAVETEDAAIIGAVIDLARNLGISTVAEGIETQTQLTHLAAKGCDVGQGYLFGRAMAARRVVQVVSSWDAAKVIALASSAEWAPAMRKIHQERFSNWPADHVG